MEIWQEELIIIENTSGRVVKKTIITTNSSRDTIGKRLNINLMKENLYWVLSDVWKIVK